MSENYLIISELSNAKIRRTPDGRFSVYDLIRVCTGKKNPRQMWTGNGKAGSKGLINLYPEVVLKIDNYKFEGKGQKETPVANVEGCLYILGLLPGECGKTYREKAANLVRRYIEGDSELAYEIMMRDHDKQRVDRVKRRLDVTESNKMLAEVVVNTSHNVGYVHNQRYIGLYEKTASELREDATSAGFPVGKKESPLSVMSSRDLAMNHVVNCMVAETGNPNVAFSSAYDLRQMYERQTKQKLTPKWVSGCLTPEKARRQIHQMELPLLA